MTSNATAVRQPDRDLEYELISMLRSHGEREGAALAAYEHLSAESPDEGVRYLASLILDDERRHHHLFADMLNDLESFVWELARGPSVPGIGTPADSKLRDETRRLLALEREDAKELRRLRKDLRHSPRSSLLPLLVNLMIHDTAKHIEILEFIKAHTARRLPK